MARYTIDKKSMHPKDLACLKAEQARRARERNWSDNICEPHRIYDALNGEAGYDHRDPVRQAIRYNEKTKLWEMAPLEYGVTQPSNSSDRVTRRVTQDGRQIMNRYKGGSF